MEKKKETGRREGGTTDDRFFAAGCRSWLPPGRDIFHRVFIEMEWTGQEEGFTMKRQKLTYRFHNPNPPEVAAAYLLKVLVEVNAPKVEAAIRKAALEDT